MLRVKFGCATRSGDVKGSPEEVNDLDSSFYEKYFSTGEPTFHDESYPLISNPNPGLLRSG